MIELDGRARWPFIAAVVLVLAGGAWETRRRERATLVADARRAATWAADSTWLAHLNRTQPHVARLPDGQGDTVTVVFSYAACPDAARRARVDGGLP